MSSAVAGGTAPGRSASTLEETAYRKVGWRLIPFLIIAYTAAYLDRVNVGFAKLQMLGDLHMSDAAYGLGAGIFFIGYFLFEVPSNLVLHRVGARVWIARIMISWGVISGLTMFVPNEHWFYIMRFLLGAAEAGFFPGIILYLTYWYPAERRGHMTAWFLAAVALAGLIGSPLSGWILGRLDGVAALAGWKWLFIIEAVPSIVLGIITLFYLDDRIRHAKWLNDAEKRVLEQNIAAEAAERSDLRLGEVFRSGRLWAMALIYFSFVAGLYGVSFWLPTIVKAAGVKSDLTIGLLTAIPWAFSIVAMILVSMSSDRYRERRWHIAISAIVSAIAFVLSTVWGGSATMAIVTMTVAVMGIMVVLPIFWSLPTALVTGAAAAAGIALINSVGNLAGFLGPSVVGYLKGATHSTASGVYVLAAFMVLGALVTLAMPSRLVDK